MTEPVSIARRTETSRFDHLVKQGIELGQQYSGQVWTDYNVHDPGRTILEHLCYGLTDLVYKAGFPVEDYLCDGEGRVKFESLGLKSPVEILPCRPVTVTDYRKVLLDQVPGLSHVDLSRINANGSAGLYRVTLRLTEAVDTDEQARVEELVRKVYCQQRNLCEDIAEICVAPAIGCELHAHIEVAGNQDMADLLAKIYFATDRCVSREIDYQHYADALQSKGGAEKLLRGPFTKKGFIADEVLSSDSGVDLLELISALNNIDGVHEIKSLSMVANDRSYSRYLDYQELAAAVGNSQPTTPRLLLPQNTDQIKVVLSKDGRPLVPDIGIVKAKFEALQFQFQYREKKQQDLAQLLPQPAGRYRDLQQYVSIQNDFPDNFNINAYGLPDSASAAEKARAAQLKGYLLLFDQILANFGANLQNLDKLFAPETGDRVTAWFKPLDSKSVPDVKALYKFPPTEILPEIIQRYDNFFTRKSRLLDYLLALYGEKFTQTALRQIAPADGDLAPEERLVKNKIRLLDHIVSVNRDRSAGDNYLSDLWGDGPVSGFKLKCKILLGLEQLRDAPLATEPDTDGFHLVEHILLRSTGGNSPDTCKVAADFYPSRISVLFPAWTTRGKQEKYRHLAEETIAKNCPAHIYPQFYWLEKDRMAEFESLYRSWAQEKKDWRPYTAGSSFDQAVAEMIDFLLAESGRRLG